MTPDPSPQTPQAPEPASREAPDPTPAQEPAEPEQQQPGNPNREAAKYRRQLRDVEAKRDALRAKVDERDRQEVERLAAERFTDPRDVWAVVNLDDLRAEDGTVGLDKVKKEFVRLSQDRPHWVRRGLDTFPGPQPMVEPNGPSFGQAIRKAGRT